MKYGQRKPISRSLRKLVYEKYDGHCAYCGKVIGMKEMQVDHIIPIMYAVYGTAQQRAPIQLMVDDGRMDEIDNLNPSCRPCNFYKGMLDIDGFRQRILSELEHTCRSSFQTRLAMQYGMIEYKPFDGKFYFERCRETHYAND